MNSAILVIARQEMRVNMRNRWTVMFTGVFGVLALAIAYFGMLTAGYAGVQGFERTAASMLSLVLYLIPLIALTMGAVSLTGERGAAELLFSQPVARKSILLGKVLGMFGSLSTAMLVGFGAAATIIAIEAGTDGLLRFTGFVFAAHLLALAVLSIAAFLAVLGETRARALGLALFGWFFLVLFYDVLILGAGSLLRERAANTLAFLSVFGNPVDAARITALITVGGSEALGSAGAALLKFLGGANRAEAILVITMSAWVAVPIAISCRLMSRRDI